MLTKATLGKLQALADREDRTLTIYLDIDQQKVSNRKRGWLVQADSLLKELMETNDEDTELARAGQRAHELLSALEPQGKSAMVVVNLGAGIEETHQLRVPLPPGARWERGAYLRPLIEAMDEYERYAVVLTDKKRARIFTVYMGEITEHSDLWSPTSSKIAGTARDERWSQARQQRHHEQEVAWHAKRIVEALQELSLRLRFDRLIVAGPKEVTAVVAKLLPKRLHGKLVRTLPMAITAGKEEVLEKVTAVQESMEREHELRLVEGLMTELHESGKAVSGLDAVCRAVSEARVWRLLWASGYSASGAECTSCGTLAPGTAERCPACGGSVRTVTHLIDRLAQGVLAQGGQVEIVAGQAAERLAEVGSIAALLRY